ncbi:MAG: transport-associated protein [Flaviaesturariibacter sp.]|nr:transport-associated protein [Flaviaesturariibacter sp.]
MGAGNIVRKKIIKSHAIKHNIPTMKTRNKCRQWLLLSGLVLFAGCKQEKMDSEIKADITVKAKQEIGFAGLQYTVDKGVANLSGNCPSQKEKDRVLATVKKIAGIKSVSENIAIGPVLLDSTFSIKQSADSLLGKYNRAVAVLENNQVTLKGEVKSKDLPAIEAALQKLGLQQKVVNLLQARG